MILGSHNSMTFLPPARWWVRPFQWMYRCQSKNLEEQLEAGVRYFDFRLVFDKGQNPHFAHGMATLKGDVLATLFRMHFQAGNLTAPHEKIYIRLINERDRDHATFIRFCKFVEEHYTNITWVGGINKSDWRRLYTFAAGEPELIDKYSSNNHDHCEFDGDREVSHKNFTGSIWDDLFPKIYAKKNNAFWRSRMADREGVLLQDFIGVY